MPESPKSPPGRPRSEASRAALLDAAYWQVSERGYGAVTLEAIARAAGAGKQTVYRWWPSKSRLVLEAFVAKARERIDRPRETAQRAGEIEKYLIADFAALRPFADALRGLLAEAVDDPDLLSALRRDFLDPRAAALTVALARAFPEVTARARVVEAVEGAIIGRVILAEPLDEGFARALSVGWLAAPRDPS